MKETFGLRIEKDDKEWIMSHSNPQDFMRKLIHEARYGHKPKGIREIITERFDYEAFEKKGVDCRFGSYVREKRKVLCQCTYPSIRKLKLGVKNLVDPWICEAHFNSDAFQSLLTWVDTSKEQREEKKKTPEQKRYERGLKEAKRQDAKR